MDFSARQHAKRLSFLQQRASSMRETPTHSETLLWNELRSSNLGTPFRRQVVLGGRFIADFVAPRERLVVEVDGGYHQHRLAADARREHAIENLGYRVLRLSDELVERDMPQAIALIREAIAAAPR